MSFNDLFVRSFLPADWSIATVKPKVLKGTLNLGGEANSSDSADVSRYKILKVTWVHCEGKSGPQILLCIRSIYGQGPWQGGGVGAVR